MPAPADLSSVLDRLDRLEEYCDRLSDVVAEAARQIGVIASAVIDLQRSAANAEQAPSTSSPGIISCVTFQDVRND